MIFRVIAGFVAQIGLLPDHSITAENLELIKRDPKLKMNSKLTLTYTTAGTNTRTTKIVLNLSDNAFLDNQGFTPLCVLDSMLDIFSGYSEGASRSAALIKSR